MGIADPQGFGFLTDLMNQVGDNASFGLGSKPTGLRAMRRQQGAFENAPPTVLPGGGILDPGRSRETARELAPSEQLPLYQEARSRNLGLAGEEAGAANLGAGQEELGQQYRTQLQSIIGPMLIRLGFDPRTSSAVTGGGGFLAKLLSGGF